MQFLCLHGAIANTENFSIQLDPLEKELAADQAASFRFINGLCEVLPPQGFEDYFGIGPHWRWFDDGGKAEDGLLSRVRALPSADTPEDVIRALAPPKPEGAAEEDTATEASWRNQRELLDYLYGTMEAHPDIQGVVGYSEGASIAASLVLDEMHRSRTEGRPRQLKCAMFLTGWPPISPDQKRVLADEDPVIIDIPTLHVIGANDPYKDGALALYNVCNEDTAVLFDTGKGHTIPRGGLVLQELGDAIRQMIGLAPIHRPIS